MQTYTLWDLAHFLINAKKATYAGDGRELENPQRPGFKELEYKEGDWSYRDSYAGFFQAQGQETVRFREEPIWAMAYAGGMMPGFREIDFAKETFRFLKEALRLVPEDMPFRGPHEYHPRSNKKFYYTNFPEGDLTSFKGTEYIHVHAWADDSKPISAVFKQEYIGGLILPKI